MKPPIPTRLGALAASLLVTFATVYLIANHALPEPPATELAQATPRP